MKTVYQVLAILAALATLSGCRQSGTDGKSICVGTRLDPGTRSGEETVDRNLQPLFLFWTPGNFNRTDKTTQDFFVRTPEGEIDAYSVSAYNTEVFYPLYDQTVYATGLAPAPGEGYLEFVTENDYSRFVIPGGTSAYGDDAHGAVDVLVAPTVQGKNSSPIANPLVFSHVLTKLSFRATLSQTMTKQVKYITVEFPGSLAPLDVVWNGTDNIYEVGFGTDGTDDFVFGNFWTTDGRFLSPDPRANSTHFYMLSKDKVSSMGYTFIAPPGVSSIPVTIRYKMCDTIGGFDVPDPMHPVRDIEKELTLHFVDTDGAPVVLGAGDSYMVTFVFDAVDIELVGQLRPWEDGGYIPLPFQPTK